MRIDRWLWAARFFKTRGAATDAVAAGHVKVAGERVKAARDVRVGDTVEIRARGLQWTVDVRGLAEKRGSAQVAAGLYEETAASVAARAQRAFELRLAHAPGADLGARPTKRDRRRLDALRRHAP